jgi:hypothetical protein
VASKAPRKPDAAVGQPVPPEDDGLVAVVKDGTVIRVHPTCVKAHLGAGWKVQPAPELTF